MRAYHRLTEGQRNQVYALKKAGLHQYAIADQIGDWLVRACWQIFGGGLTEIE